MTAERTYWPAQLLYSSFQLRGQSMLRKKEECEMLALTQNNRSQRTQGHNHS